MIRIDNVRSTVLTVLQEENRGWLTPSEFNDLARQAQLERFEEYFYELSHFSLNPKGKAMETGYSNIIKNLEEKIDIFSASGTLGASDYDSTTKRFTLPSNLYRLDTVTYSGAVVSKMDKNKQPYISRSTKMRPSTTFPKYIRIDDKLQVFPEEIVSGLDLYYIKRPADPVWNSINFGGTAPVFDESSSTHFELHSSDEYVMVEKILLYAGVALREPLITQTAAGKMGQEEQIKRS